MGKIFKEGFISTLQGPSNVFILLNRVRKSGLGFYKPAFGSFMVPSFLLLLTFYISMDGNNKEFDLFSYNYRLCKNDDTEALQISPYYWFQQHDLVL